MAGGHGDHGGGHDSHAKKSGGGGGGFAKAGEKFIERFAIVLLVLGLASCAFNSLPKSGITVTIPTFGIELPKGQPKSAVPRGCPKGLIAPWPCHKPLRP
jgi:hypothetical protein